MSLSFSTGLDYIRRHSNSEAEIEEDQEEDEDFFSSMKVKKTNKLEGYLSCCSENIDLLHSFSALKKLSIHFSKLMFICHSFTDDDAVVTV